MITRRSFRSIMAYIRIFSQHVFKNCWWSDKPKSSKSNAEAVPRFSGDNLVLLIPEMDDPKQEANRFDPDSTNPILAINTRLNWFQDTNSRPAQSRIQYNRFCWNSNISSSHLEWSQFGFSHVTRWLFGIPTMSLLQ